MRHVQTIAPILAIFLAAGCQSYNSRPVPIVGDSMTPFATVNHAAYNSTPGTGVVRQVRATSCSSCGSMGCSGHCPGGQRLAAMRARREARRLPPQAYSDFGPAVGCACGCAGGQPCLASCNSGGCPAGACGAGGCGAGGPVNMLAAMHAQRHHSILQKGHANCAYGSCGGQLGPQQGQVTFPYYTVRGPRDFLNSNPPSIGR